MTYWLCITSEDNWKVAKSQKVWGVSEKDRKKVDRLEINDFLVFYVKQRRKNDQIIRPEISGIFKVTSKPFRSEESIFSSPVPQEKFPWRVRIEPVAVPKAPLDFKKLLPNLKFVKNKKKWFLYLQKAMRTISEEDFNLVKSASEER